MGKFKSPRLTISFGIIMNEGNIQGEIFEIDDEEFECLVCEELIEFNFEAQEIEEPGTSEDLPEEFEEEFEEDLATPENFTDEVETEMEENSEETMRVDCECGAEYMVKKVPGVPGFEVTHLVESEPELAEKEFEQEFEV